MCPRRGTFFSCVAKKRRQKKATPSLRPLRFAKGQTCVGTVAGCAAELTARLGRSVQTAAASQMTKHGRFDAHATPQPPRRRRSHRGWITKQPNIQTATRVVAALDSVSAAPSARRLRPRSRAEQRDGPCGCWFPIPCVCAEERSGQRIRDRDCLSAVKRSEFERDPAGREHRRLPEAKRRDADSGVAFFCLLFLATQEKKVPRRGHIPAPALGTGMRPNQPISPSFDGLSPNGQGRCPGNHYQFNSC